MCQDKDSDREGASKDGSVCIVCRRQLDDSLLDKYRVCLECRKGSSETMPRRLPVVTLDNGKTYFIDERLKELRNVHDIDDYIKF